MAVVTPAFDQFFLVAQPVVPLSNRERPSYYEMLLRIRDEDGDVQTPDVLLDPSTEGETLEQIDAWVFRSTAQWLSQNPGTSASVNVTTTAMSSGQALLDVWNALEDFDVDPGRLMLEVPEELVTNDQETFGRSAAAARDLGVRIAIDDLGTGWHALSTIRDVGVDAIKIDGFWVSRAATDDIAELTVQSIVNASRLIGARVVAEWIEDEKTFALMQRMGIEYGQGWLFGYPRPIEEVASDSSEVASAA